MEKHPEIKFGKTGVLIINLGTPDSTNWLDVRRYLKEFLSDRRVIEVNPIIWQIDPVDASETLALEVQRAPDVRYRQPASLLQHLPDALDDAEFLDPPLAVQSLLELLLRHQALLDQQAPEEQALPGVPMLVIRR